MKVERFTLWHCSEDYASEIAHGLKCALELADRRDSIQYHNAFMEYTLVLLLFSTGHRPVEDVFGQRYQIDECSGFALVDDKVSNEQRRFNLVYLSDIASAQMRAYLRHISLLEKHLRSVGAYGIANALSNQIQASQNCSFPLFFYLGTAEIKYIDEAAISAIYSRFTAVPANRHRSWIGQMLGNSHLPHWVIATALRHADVSILPWGDFCSSSPMDIRSRINSVINPALEAVGWIVIESAFLPQYALTQCYGKFSISQRKSAQVRRKEKRGANRKVAKSLVIEFVEDITSRYSDKNPLDRDGFNAILRDLVDRLRQMQLPIVWSLEVFGRFASIHGKSWFGRRRALWIRKQLSESSPWDGAHLQGYRQSHSCRQNLLRYINALAKQGVRINSSQICAIRLFLLAFFGGFCKKADLQKVLINHCCAVQVNDTYYVQFNTCTPVGEAPAYRLDTISSCLSNKIHIAGSIDRKSVENFVLKIGVDIGLASNSVDKLIDELINCVKNISRFKSVGLVRAEKLGRINTASLKLSTLCRLHFQRPLSNYFPHVERYQAGLESLIRQYDVPHPDLRLKEFIAGMNGVLGEKSRSEFIKSTKKEGGGEIFVNGELSSRQKCNLLAKYFVSELKTSLPVLVQLVAHWGYWMCNNMTRHGHDIEASTIIDYVRLVASKLGDHVKDMLLLYEPDEWEAAYLRALEGSVNVRMKDLAARFLDFHDYLVNHWDIADIEWDEIFSLAGYLDKSGRVDANLLVPAEYHALIKVLSERNEREFILCAWLIFLGYQFGLRWSEAYYLLSRDFTSTYFWWQYFVNVRKNSFRRLKSFSSQRRVHQLEEFSEDECRIIELVVSPHLPMNLSTTKRERLLCSDPKAVDLFDEWEMSRLVNRVLKNVSGDGLLRFQHLRHGFACRRWLGFNMLHSGSPLDFSRDGLLDDVDETHFSGVVPQRGLSDLLGHKYMATTVKSYLHVMDWTPFSDINEFGYPSSHTLAFFLGRSESAIRKSLSRGKISENNRWLWLQKQHIDKHSESPVKLSKEFSVDLELYKLVTNDYLDPRIVHRLLIRYSVYGRMTGLIARMSGIDFRLVDKVIETGIELECLSGCEIFSLQPHLEPFVPDTFRNRTAWNNVETALMEIFRLEISESGFVHSLDEAIQVWSVAYHPSCQDLFFENAEHLMVFCLFLRKIGTVLGDASYHLKGQIMVDGHCKSRLLELGVQESGRISKYQRASKGRRKRQGSIVLTIGNISGIITSKNQLNRLLFVAGVVHRYRTLNRV